ncbi:MAG: hypothetical protein GY906_11440 [bacterium]|nr:hypothetical protein [bacterium]
MINKAFTLEEEQESFDAQLDSLLESHEGHWVLFKDKQVVDIFPDSDTAYTAGLERFGTDSLFLVLPVERPSPLPLSVSWDLGVAIG